MSRRAVAERFGVSAASAVRWVQVINTTGRVDVESRPFIRSVSDQLAVQPLSAISPALCYVCFHIEVAELH
jgi:hypothetical protein